MAFEFQQKISYEVLVSGLKSLHDILFKDMVCFNQVGGSAMCLVSILSRDQAYETFFCLALLML